VQVISGIQPTGRLHWGNYFGALDPILTVQADHEVSLFVANLHALTTVQDGPLLARWTFDTVLDVLALGFDAERGTLFLQSDVPEVSELYWLLMTVCPVGLLARGHAYKDAGKREGGGSGGILSYPVLMAADILAQGTELVVVGDDQRQHVEICRDLAGAFNHRFGDTFALPVASIADSRLVPGTDGERKMSKRYGNTIGVLEDPASAQQKIRRMKTDSQPISASKDPDPDPLFHLYGLFADDAERRDMANRYRAGGLAYGVVKEELGLRFRESFAEARRRRAQLERDPEAVLRVLERGSETARERARRVLARAREAVGLSTGDLIAHWRERRHRRIFESHPEIDRLEEPTRSTAAAAYAGLRDEGVDRERARELAVAEAREWASSRAPTARAEPAPPARR
jgi:tryptophanyl-tRNA synthetase